MTDGPEYYREPGGDYLRVIAAEGWAPNMMGVRAAAIRGLPSSVCSCAASRCHLRMCEAVRAADVPGDWRYALALEGDDGC